MAKSKMKWYHWLLVGVAGIVTVSAIAGVSYASKDELKLNAGAFKVADVDEQGRVYEAETAIVSKLIETKEVEIEFDKDAEVTVIVHYYDKDENFLSSTAGTTKDGKVTAPEGAEYMRFELVHEKDDEISFTDKIEYCGMVDIIYQR